MIWKSKLATSLLRKIEIVGRWEIYARILDLSCMKRQQFAYRRFLPEMKDVGKPITKNDFWQPASSVYA